MFGSVGVGWRKAGTGWAGEVRVGVGWSCGVGWGSAVVDGVIPEGFWAVVARSLVISVIFTRCGCLRASWAKGGGGLL